MNKKYMDFVPKRPREVVKKPVFDERKESPEIVREEPVINRVERTEKEVPNYGVVEDFHPKFIRTLVKKRPLNKSVDSKEKTEISQIKAEKLVGKTDVKEKEVLENAPKKDVLSVPKTRFVNTEKIEKRPLSKNVYKKKIVPAKEKVSGPVTIISKPEKDSKVGIVVAIILTIILGAVAGTVAFFLLPK